jgi:biotin carboxyl carrier protein
VTNFHNILSPLPGTFYRSPTPEAPPYKADGDLVAVGDVIGLVEVMKQFNEITADVAGKIVKFSVDNGEPIEIGQSLALLAFI